MAERKASAAASGSEAEATAPRASVASLAIRAFAAVAVLAAIALAVIPSYWGYEPRRRVSEAIASASALRERVAAFHAESGRFPSPAEAPRFRLQEDELRWARSVAYDASGPMIVVTMNGAPYEGRRFAYLLRADAASRGIAAECVSIDLETKFLPAACRNLLGAGPR